MNGQEFQSWRERLHLTQREAAELLGYTDRHVRTWEKSGAATEVPKAVALACRYLEEHPEARATAACG